MQTFCWDMILDEKDLFIRESAVTRDFNTRIFRGEGRIKYNLKDARSTLGYVIAAKR